MNIFLDTNILYKDPFFQREKLIILKELARCREVNIYINRAVLEEIKRGYIEYVDCNLKNLEKANKNLNKNIINSSEHLTITRSKEQFIENFENNISNFINEGILNITPYYTSVVEEIVKIDMYQNSPFNKNKRFLAVRDAVIWYSYIQYIKEYSLTECYFISNNTKEFADSHKTAQENTSYTYKLSSLFEYIPFETAHKSVGDFIEYYKEDIQNIFEENSVDIINEQQLIYISSLFSSAINSLETNILDLCESAVEIDLENTTPLDIFGYYRGVDYLDGSYTEGELIGDLEIKGVSSYGSRIIVEVVFEYLKEVDLYEYNSVRDKEDEHYSYCGNIPIVYTIKAILTWSIINHLCLLENKQFSLEDIINITDAEDISIDIISLELLQDEYFDDGLDLNY